MSNTLELKVVFAAIDKFVRPVKSITGAASQASKALRDNTASMKELNKTVAQIDAFKKLEKDAAITANAFKGTQTRIAEVKAELAKLPAEVQNAGQSWREFTAQRMAEYMRTEGGHAGAMKRMGAEWKAYKEKAAPAAGEVGKKAAELTQELARLSRQSSELKAKHQSLTVSEQALFEKLKAAGIDTRHLAEQRQRLASASAEAANQSRRLTAALDAENQKMKRLHAAQADMRNARERAGKLAMAGAGITAAGAAVGLPAAKSAKDYADFETAMLGVARQMDGARDDAGKVTRTYWEMADAIKALSERLPGTAADIAKIVEGGARMGIQGKDNLLTFTETTAVMAKAFDLPVDEVGKDIGQISQLYKVPIKDIKSLGDTINWLDDNALAKGGDIIDVMKRIAGTADMAKMSFREAAALGSTFLSLGANSEVAASASNAMIRELAVANMQSKRFKGGLAMLGLDGSAVQSGMAKDATGTIIMVLEKIKALAGDKQLEAATRLFGKEFGDDAAKLASSLGEYRRQLQLVKDQKAMGSMQREADAWADTLNARIEQSRDAFSNLSSDLGRHLKPAIADTLEKTLSIVQAVRAWSAENPNLSAGLMTATKWLAIALTVIGGLTVAAGAILVPLAALKFSMVTLGLSGAGAFGAIATAIRVVGLALVANPVGLTLTAIATAATLIYANWDKLTAWWTGALDKIIGRINRLKENLRYMMPGLFGGLESSPTRASTTAAIAASPVLRAGGGNNYAVTVNANGTSAADANDIALQIRRELERMEAKNATRQRSRLRDTE